MTKNTFKLFKSNVPKAQKAKGNDVKPKGDSNTKSKRPMSEFDMKLLALKERSTKKYDGQKAAKKPLVIAQPLFVAPAQATEDVVEVDFVDGLTTAQRQVPIASSAVTAPEPVKRNQFDVLSEETADQFKVKIAPSLFSLPPRAYDDADL